MKKIIALLCVVSLLAGFCAGCNSNSNGNSENKEPVQIRTYIALHGFDDKLGIIYNDTCILTEYKYKNSLPMSYSLDGTAALCLTDEGALLYIHDGTVEKIVDGPASYRFSASGNAIAFRIEEENVEQSGLESGLYLYEKASGQAKLVIADTERYARSYTFSPDGKTLAYVTTESIWDCQDTRLMIHRDGTSTLRTQFEKDVGLLRVLSYDVISINDSADIIYLHYENRLISVNQEGEVKNLGKNVDQIGIHYTFYCNADHSQLLYGNEAGTYLSQGGEQGVKLSDVWMFPVEPALSSFHYDTKYADEGIGSQFTVTCDFEDLSKHVMRTFVINEGVMQFWYPNDNGKFAQVREFTPGPNDEESFWLDPTGSKLYYSPSSRALYYLDLKAGGEPTLLAKETVFYVVSYDCSTLYYFYRNLFSSPATDTTEAKEVPIDGSIYDVCFSENNQVFFKCSVDTHKDLCTLSKEGEQLVVLQNLLQFVQYPCGMIFLATGESYKEIDGYYIIRAGELIELKMQNME